MFLWCVGRNLYRSFRWNNESTMGRCYGLNSSYFCQRLCFIYYNGVCPILACGLPSCESWCHQDGDWPVSRSHSCALHGQVSHTIFFLLHVTWACHYIYDKMINQLNLRNGLRTLLICNLTYEVTKRIFLFWRFVIFAKRIETTEARLRVFCMTDDREEKTLEGIS